eukprot:gnl/MRDRNA2_/MRDRNA2_115345_c0_seq1.p1 gnl/MRDRNA2_/MRDRNA2_115345_c0~~gnl/MRDRNA2_/MRDRNA2_115345_c0_seq1.p1  ORF type:complete len:148 (+),score=32.74 gnl/MRDRNA2_/MRDRNA2_115345_c0_seq1:258-701(+)
MCRDEAVTLHQNADDLKQAGAKRVVCLLKEDLPDQVEEFRNKFWPGELFLDQDKGFYKALGGGQYLKKHSTSTFLMTLLNPFSADPVKDHISKAKSETNLTGEGYIHGGLYVVRQTGITELGFVEEDLGVVCPINKVKEAVQAACAA